MNNLNFKELEEINGGGRTWDNITTAIGVGYRYIKIFLEDQVRSHSLFQLGIQKVI
ncbi:hypothetical protein [Clostridium sardiniense]|uniref:hypothetical protein n=1 Tax=Clostridium sardiniense TaxID=29369 RepID=UPI00195CC3C3|nr:hypothetical protein [Clostridium sardiniense]MBM7833225.1 hypothetical protein [Clostridium sardiniense]